MAQQNSSEEVDLGTLWEKVKNIQTNILLFFYRMVRFLLKNWIILLGLIIIGILVGYFLEKDQRRVKEGSLIVQINFDASNYVYNSVEHLNNKISDSDMIFLNEMGFYENEEPILIEVEIEPIVNITDILNNKINADNRNVESFLEQAQYEDNLLTSEIFIPEYKTHRINIKTTDKGSPVIIEKLLAYLNDNDLMQQIKELTIVNTKNHIKQTKESIASIDSIVKKYGAEVEREPASQVYVNSIEGNDNIHLLFSLKNTLIMNNEELEVELLKYGNIVTLIGNPYLAVKKSFFDEKMKILPIIFVLLFILISIIIKLYNKAAKIEHSKKKYKD